MRHVARLVVICVTVLRYGLDELALSSFRQRWVRLLVRVITIGRRLDAPRGVRLRLALERLGPIFVKFGQVLSTRRDLLPADIADELAQAAGPRAAVSARGRASRIVETRVRPAARRDLRELRRRAGGERVDRAGALRASLHGRPRGRGQGAAPGHAARRSTTTSR